MCVGIAIGVLADRHQILVRERTTTALIGEDDSGIRMRIVKLSEPDAEGGFDGEIQDVHFENAAGERIPNIPLGSPY